MHWADVIAKELASKHEKQLISSGISPTGLIHVGSLREAITAEAIRKAVKEGGQDVRMIYLIDSYDPLRRRYDFLPPSFEQEVGRPISHIPCPCGCHDNYAHHYIQPFMDSMSELGVECEIYWTHELYEKGLFAECIDDSFQKRDLVLKILNEVTGREMPSDFYPYSPRCGGCGKFSPKIVSYQKPFVNYRCDCGFEGTSDITKGEGKLSWRLEWPAKWKIFGVTCEPFGKDHAAAGGSYDSGVRLVQEIYGAKAPYPVPYEFVQLKGKGQMHKSTGSSVTGVDAIRMTPAAVLNYTMLRVNPERHIDYDSEMGILDMVDEYDRVERLHYVGNEENEEDLVRAYILSQPRGLKDKLPLQIPYRHLVNVVQLTNDFGNMLEILKRTEDLGGSTVDDLKLLEQRADCVRYWLNGFAPDMVKFSISEELPSTHLAPDELEFLSIVYNGLLNCPWSGEQIHNVTFEASKTNDLGAKKGFQTLYRIFIERRSGPRMGHFLATLDKDFVLKRIADAVTKNQ